MIGVSLKSHLKVNRPPKAEKEKMMDESETQQLGYKKKDQVKNSRK